MAGAALALSLALVFAVLEVRRRAARLERARERFFAIWRPLIFANLEGGPLHLPRVLPRDEESFLLLWIQLQDGLQREARAGFRPIAEAVGARRMIRRRLDRGNVLGKFLALRTLGHLGDPADYEDVLAHLDERRTYLCAAAARALVHIDPVRAPRDVLSRLAVRTDWPIPLFCGVLADADPGPVLAWVRAELPRLAPGPLVRLMPLLSILDPASTEDLLRDLLSPDRDPEVLCAALKRVSRPSLAPLVRRACGHPLWTVRTQAAAALGRMGGMPGRYALFRLLGDRQWWVRYRAAQALCATRLGRADEIRRMVAALHDPYAHDAVEHALAEQAFFERRP